MGILEMIHVNRTPHTRKKTKEKEKEQNHRNPIDQTPNK